MHGQLLFTAWLPSHRELERENGDDSGWEGDVSGSSSEEDG